MTRGTLIDIAIVLPSVLAGLAIGLAAHLLNFV